MEPKKFYDPKADLVIQVECGLAEVPVGTSSASWTDRKAFKTKTEIVTDTYVQPPPERQAKFAEIWAKTVNADSAAKAANAIMVGNAAHAGSRAMESAVALNVELGKNKLRAWKADASVMRGKLRNEGRVRIARDLPGSQENMTAAFALLAEAGYELTESTRKRAMEAGREMTEEAQKAAAAQPAPQEAHSEDAHQNAINRSSSQTAAR
jgi:hypothetical protein